MLNRWLESEYGRGYNEIISCLSHFLEEKVLPLINSGEIDGICLFCDSCAAQNKNYFLLFALRNFCRKYSINFHWFFPVRGHSYMPADRAFSFISRKVKNIELVLSPTEYDDVVRSVGNLFIVGEDLCVNDYKNAASNFLKVYIILFFIFLHSEKFSH